MDLYASYSLSTLSLSKLTNTSSSHTLLISARPPPSSISKLLNLSYKPLRKQPRSVRAQFQNEIDNHEEEFITERVPHLTDFLPDLQSYPNPLKKSPAYSIVKETFVSPRDVVAQKIVLQKDSPRGVHFPRAGPREKVYFKSEEVRACIVTCGGLCPGINTVIREIVCGLNIMYGVDDILGIEGGYKGFYSKNTKKLTPKIVDDIHKRGGTLLQTSRGGHDTIKIVDNIQDRGINQVYIIGGDGTQRGANAIYKEVEKRGLQVSVAGIPKTIDNDIADHFTKVRKMTINLKYIDPTYMIRAVPSNASDNIYCTLLAQSVVHGAMAGYTGFTVGPVNSRHAYIPISCVTETQNVVKLTDRSWARLLASTNQPSFIQHNDVGQEKVNQDTIDAINNTGITSI